MTWQQHLRGVLIAIVTAVVLLFVVSFFVGDEIRVNKTYVVNSSADSVYAFIKSPKNFNKFIEDIWVRKIIINLIFAKSTP